MSGNSNQTMKELKELKKKSKQINKQTKEDRRNEECRKPSLVTAWAALHRGSYLLDHDDLF